MDDETPDEEEDDRYKQEEREYGAVGAGVRGSVVGALGWS